MVLGVVEEETRYRLDVGFSAAFHPHHARLEERHHLQFRQLREEHLVRRPPPGVGLGRGAVEAVSSQNDSL